MKKKSLLTLLFFLLFSIPGYGSENSDQLVKILEYKQQFKDFLENCLAIMGSGLVLCVLDVSARASNKLYQQNDLYHLAHLTVEITFFD